MLKRKCRSLDEAQTMLTEIAAALKCINEGIYWDAENPGESSFAFLGPIRPEFLQFLKTLTGAEDLSEIVDTIGIRVSAGEAVPAYIIQLTPVYKEAIRRKLQEWQEEIEQKQLILQRWQADKPRHGYGRRAEVSL